MPASWDSWPSQQQQPEATPISCLLQDVKGHPADQQKRIVHSSGMQLKNHS